MKNQIKLPLFALLLVATSSFAVSAFAEEAPCKQIKAACEAGGFVKGGHKNDGKGLFKDCMKKILAGESVAGVTVPADEVAACKAKKEKRNSAKHST